MKKIVIASLNPAKINAVKHAFQKVFPEQEFHFNGISIASEVPAQPMSDTETKLGALNRVRNAKNEIQNADFYVGLEL